MPTSGPGLQEKVLYDPNRRGSEGEMLDTQGPDQQPALEQMHVELTICENDKVRLIMMTLCRGKHKQALRRPLIAPR